MRNQAFLELRQGLRDALGRSDSPAVGVDDIPRLNWELNRAYEKLWAATAWKHLETIFTPFVANAGQQFFSLPAGCDSTRILEVRNFWNAGNTPVVRGIGFKEYNIWNSYAGQQSEPVSRYDIRWQGNLEQMELWPVASDGSQSIYVRGTQGISRLVGDSDICLLDDNLVILQAACRLIKDQQELQELKIELSEIFNDAKANAGEDRRTVAVGGHEPSPVHDRVVLRVKNA